MKRNICLALAALGLSAALVVPADAQYSLLLDYSSPDGSAQAAPPQGPEVPFWVRINAVREDAGTDAVVGDMQFRFHYDGDKVDSSGLSAAIPLSTSAYAAAVSASPTLSGDVAGTDRYRTVLLSYDPTDAPLSFAVGTNRGVQVGDISPIAVVGLETTDTFPVDVTEATGFGVSVDPDFPQIARAELGGTYSDVDGSFAVDLETFLSYDPAVDKAGDGRPDTDEADFVFDNPAPPATNSLLFDTSSNGISDGLAVILGLDPRATSTAGDGILDGVALVLMQNGVLDDDGNIFDPAVANVFTDTLGDGLPDQYGLTENTTGNPDTNVDSDFGQDGASNAYEVATGFDPEDSSSTPPVGDVLGTGSATGTDALRIFDFSGFSPAVVPYEASFPFPSRAKTVPGSPAITATDALRVFDYAGFAADQIR